MEKKKLLTLLLRWILAAVFIFSGFVKGVDPWGTAIKIGEYLSVMGLEPLSGAKYIFSVLLSGGEMFLGFCLLFGIGGKITSRLLLAAITLFTLVTLVLAVWNPISDCGCFGDAIKLTNWETFYKNLILLTLAICIVSIQRREKRYHINKDSRVIKWSLGLLFALFSLGVGFYGLRHLPIIDFLPFKVGVNIPDNMASLGAGESTTTLIYKDLTTGKNSEFTLTDTTWYDSNRWEFVDTRIEVITPNSNPTISDFSIFDLEGNHTQELLTSYNELIIIPITNIGDISSKCKERLVDVIEYAKQQDIKIIAITTSFLPLDQQLRISDYSIPLYNIDGVTLKTIIRAHEGLIVIKEGTIIAKWSCRDIPQFTKDYSGKSLLSVMSERAEQTKLMWLIGVILFTLLIIYVAYNSHRLEK